MPELKSYNIKNNNDNLCVIFFNLDVIVNNKFYIDKKINTRISVEGVFDFKIDDSIKFFNKAVFNIRTYYSKEELLEQIRERISKIIFSVIKDKKSEYKLNNVDIYSKLNVFGDYGITITYCDIENIKIF